jgi:hypothetical protein
MRRLMLVVILPLLVGLAFAGNNLTTVSNPNAIPRPADPNAPLCVQVPVPPIPQTDVPPPWGTVLATYHLTLSGSYAGAGMTWRRDSARFYFVDQGYSGPSGMWSCTAENPQGTTRREKCVMPNLGSGTTDIPWGCAWDNDSSCFWITNIIDQSVYSGCYLVRLTLGAGDTWRLASPIQARDTWRIDGAMGCYWLGGMEKWFDRGYFCGTPVASGGAANNTVKFDPYTKTVIGHTANGTPTYSERGCALVPWDSLYICTCGWNEDNWRKRDSTGTVLQQANAATYGPADWAVWIPQNIGADDTAFVWDICSDANNTFEKISTGLLWNQLPSINPFNVRPLAVLAPSGTIDSGQSVTPRLVIRNMSNEVAYDVRVHFTIPDVSYSDSVTGLDIPARTAETLSFTGWSPLRRDSMSVVAWTYWAGDSFPKDDTIRTRFLVRVKDIAVTQIIDPAPDTTLDSGVVLNPQCRVYNYGNVSLNFDVRFRIGTYQSTRNLSLAGGTSTVVTASDAYTAMPGIYACFCFAIVTGDLHPDNNLLVDTFTVRGTINTDVQPCAVLAPPGVIDTTMLVTPVGRFRNNGVAVASFWAFYTIRNPGGAEIYAESSQAILSPGDSTDIDYGTIQFSTLGDYVATCSTAMPGDQNSTNDIVHKPFRVVAKISGDVGVTQIVRPPVHVFPDSSFIPEAKWKNYGAQPATVSAFFFIHNKYGVRIYSQVVTDTVIGAGEEITLDFVSFNVGNDTGHWYARCSTAAGDTNFANDTLNKTFVVGLIPIPGGWTEVASLPLTPSGKMVKDGGWLVYDASKGLIFGAKGNKTSDFYAFDQNTDGWAEKSAVPVGTEAKPVSKGAAGCASGNGKLYATKGNNTLGFYEYDVLSDSWRQLKDVPAGAGKKVKGGTALAWGFKAGAGAAYLLKGYKNEFYKYSPLDTTWTTLPVAPVGAKEKWDKGSWLVSNGAGLLYAHKAKYHEFYVYDCEADSWSGPKTAMPIPGTAGSKKAKDGSAGAWLDGSIYAFKGGNTSEFWRYTPEGDSWRGLDDIPLVGTTGKKKKVKAGGALAGIPGTAVYGFKGNKCAEFWRYRPAALLMAPADREGVMAGVQGEVTSALRINPNPLAGGFATVRYSLPKAGLATLRIFDVTGRTVLSQTLVAARTGTASLDLRKLNAGVYLVKVTADGFNTTQKLVVQH